MKVLIKKPDIQLRPYTMNLFIYMCFKMNEYNRFESTKEAMRKELEYSPDSMTRHIRILIQLDMIKKKAKRYIVNPMYAIRTDGNFDVVYDRYTHDFF